MLARPLPVKIGGEYPLSVKVTVKVVIALGINCLSSSPKVNTL